MADAPHPARTMLRVLGRRERVAIGIVAVASLLEKGVVVAGTVAIVDDRPAVALAFTGGLAAAFLVRTVASSFLRLEVQAGAIRAMSRALLADASSTATPATDETELALIDGLNVSETLVGDHVPEILADIPACACMLVVAASLLPIRVMIEGAAALALGALAVLAARRVTARTADRVWGALAPVLEDVSIAVRGRAEIVASGSGLGFLSSLEQKTEGWRRTSRQAAMTSFLAGRAPAMAVAIAVGLVLLVDGGLDGSLTHSVVRRAALLASMTPAFAGLARAWIEISRCGPRLAPLAGLIEAARQDEERSAGVPPPPLPAVVSFEKVRFSFGEMEPVLDDFEAACRPGEIVALTGANGSGKSTVLSLFLGLGQPARGGIAVGGRPLAAVEPRLWRQRIGYLAQRPFLSDRASVREAMRMIAPEADTATLVHWLQKVELWPVLDHHDATSPLEVKVGSLSAGEKQRLALARVLARNAPILLLDEPDANLVTSGLRLLTELLRELAPERVVVVAAHNAELVSAADRIVRLGGRRDGRSKGVSGEAIPTLVEAAH